MAMYAFIILAICVRSFNIFLSKQMLPDIEYEWQPGFWEEL